VLVHARCSGEAETQVIAVQAFFRREVTALDTDLELMPKKACGFALKTYGLPRHFSRRGSR